MLADEKWVVMQPLAHQLGKHPAQSARTRPLKPCDWCAVRERLASRLLSWSLVQEGSLLTLSALLAIDDSY